jgi:WD40 repeat protein
MPAFTRFKLPPEVLSIGHSVSNSRLVAICNDNNMRVWDCDSGAALKGVVLDRSGEPTCLTFSKDGEYLLIGTSTGTVQVWDGATLGVNNTLVLTKAVCK